MYVYIYVYTYGIPKGKERLLPENMNRNILTEQLKEHDMRCMNTYFEKPSNKKTLIGTCGQQVCKDRGIQIDTASWIYAWCLEDVQIPLRM